MTRRCDEARLFTVECSQIENFDVSDLSWTSQVSRPSFGIARGRASPSRGRTSEIAMTITVAPNYSMQALKRRDYSPR